MADYSKMSTEDLFAEIKKIPDFERFPWPDVFYEKFGVEKPKARDMPISECLMYQPPSYQSLNEGGKAEERGPVEGGLRPVTYSALPVSTIVEPVEKPTPKLADTYTTSQFPKDDDLNQLMQKFKEQNHKVDFTIQNADDKTTDSVENS
jgi:hypothetical protein